MTQAEAVQPQQRHVPNVLHALTFTSTLTVLTILAGVLGNKVIAVMASAQGIALVGAFRTVATLATRGAGMGYETLLLQKISTAQSAAERRSAMGALLPLAGLWFLLFIALAIFAARPIAMALFPDGAGHVTEIRVVLVMAFVNLALQMCIAVLNGGAEYKKIAYLNLITAAASLAVIYPLVKWGRIGLAINVGSGSVIGLLLAGWLVQRRIGPEPWDAVRAGVERLKTDLRPVGSLTFYALTMMGALMTVQAIISRRSGLETLGIYNAAVLVVDTGIMVMMASVRNFFLPTLGLTGAQTLDEKSEFTLQALSHSLLFSVAMSVGLIVMARWAIAVLFSARFAESAQVLAIAGLSIVAQVFVYYGNALLLHQAKFRQAYWIDVCWGALLVTGIFAASRSSFGVSALAWAYSLSYIFAALLYLTTSLSGGPNDKRFFVMFAGALAWTALAYVGRNILPLQIAILLVTAGLALWTLRGSLAGRARETGR